MRFRNLLAMFVLTFILNCGLNQIIFLPLPLVASVRVAGLGLNSIFSPYPLALRASTCLHINKWFKKKCNNRIFVCSRLYAENKVLLDNLPLNFSYWICHLCFWSCKLLWRAHFLCIFMLLNDFLWLPYLSFWKYEESGYYHTFCTDFLCNSTETGVGWNIYIYIIK